MWEVGTWSYLVLPVLPPCYVRHLFATLGAFDSLHDWRADVFAEGLTYTGDKTGIYSLMVYTIFPNGRDGPEILVMQ